MIFPNQLYCVSSELFRIAYLIVIFQVLGELENRFGYASKPLESHNFLFLPFPTAWKGCLRLREAFQVLGRALFRILGSCKQLEGLPEHCRGFQLLMRVGDKSELVYLLLSRSGAKGGIYKKNVLRSQAKSKKEEKQVFAPERKPIKSSKQPFARERRLKNRKTNFSLTDNQCIIVKLWLYGEKFFIVVCHHIIVSLMQ